MGKTNKNRNKPSPKKVNQHATTREKHVSQAQPKGPARIVMPSRMVTHTVPPIGWPSTMPYLSTSIPSTTLSPAQNLLLQPPNTAASQPTLDPHIISSLVTYSPTTNPLIQIKSITDENHPAYPQCGLFAAKQLKPGSHIVDYTGQIHDCPQQTCAESDYDLAFLDRDASLAIDSAKMGNEARFVNDYHGIRAAPNAMFEEYYVKVKSNKGGKEVWQARMGIWVMPSKEGIGIEKGEEICVSYGKGWWRARRSLMEQDVGIETEQDLENTMAGMHLGESHDDGV